MYSSGAHKDFGKVGVKVLHKMWRIHVYARDVFCTMCYCFIISYQIRRSLWISSSMRIADNKTFRSRCDMLYRL